MMAVGGALWLRTGEQWLAGFRRWRVPCVIPSKQVHVTVGILPSRAYLSDSINLMYFGTLKYLTYYRALP